MKPTVKELMRAEHEEMAARYGRAGASREGAFFHTTRAKGSLDATLLAKAVEPDAAVMGRLVHLAVVCQRLAMAFNGEETG
jgi:hypothetical protein